MVLSPSGVSGEDQRNLRDERRVPRTDYTGSPVAQGVNIATRAETTVGTNH